MGGPFRSVEPNGRRFDLFESMGGFGQVCFRCR